MHRAKEVRLADRESRTQSEETYLHEVIEAINAHAELEIPHHTICQLSLLLHQALTSGEGTLELPP